MSNLTYQELSDLIAVQSLKDANFRKEFLANPAGAFEKYTGKPIVGFKIFAHENSASGLHFVLPPVIASAELSDEDLEKVAGGEFNFGFVDILPITVGPIVPNFDIKQRSGW